MTRINPKQTAFARELRHKQTEAEAVLWAQLRNRQLAEVKFRRQHPINTFVVDFSSLEQKLVIEIDGGHHNEQVNIDRDTERTIQLNAQGCRVLRFWNNDILKNMKGVLEIIEQAISENPNPLVPSLLRERGRVGSEQRRGQCQRKPVKKP